jgi:sugar phosphate isomerase/epimerase
MQLGVFDPIFGDLPLDAALDRVVALGLEAVEIGTGNYPGDARCRPAELLADRAARDRFAEAIRSRRLRISALSCHGNPIHPDSARARHDDAVFRDTVRLAAALDVGVVNAFAGCPGAGPEATRPTWIATGWPPEHPETLAWQWEAVVLPYWHDAAAFAGAHGVRIGIEMEPGFVVYHPRSFRRLREEIGSPIGLNLDPSHLFWQGVDVLDAVRELGPAIVHVDAKDTVVHAHNVAANGLLDLPSRDDHASRPWIFRSVGAGHGVEFWTAFVEALREVGYDDVISIEHEDPLLDAEDGLRLAADTLRAAVAAADSAATAAGSAAAPATGANR